MKKREKNAVFSKFKRTMVASGAAAAIIASSVVPAYAIEKDVNEPNKPAQEMVLEAEQVKSIVEPTGKEQVTKEVAFDFTKDMFSNTDADRRAALEKQYKIKLDFSDVWEDKKGQTSVNPNGTVSKYTSHDEMKEMGFYAVNANRQELIKYAIRTGDWEPYNQYERDLLAKQEATKAVNTEKTAKIDKVTDVTKQTMRVASTTPIAAPTKPVVDSTSTKVESNDTEVVNVKTSGESTTPTDTTSSPTDKVDKEKVVPVEEIVPDEIVSDTTASTVDKELTVLNSNDDHERRAALEDKFGITLDAADKWEDKKGQTSVNPDGTVSKYTSHDEMKAMGFYAVNANRQELIQYGIRTDDWQPYRAFTALSEPAYFELVDGKLEYSKIYYAKEFEATNSDYVSRIAEASTMQQHDKVKELQVEKKKNLTEIAESYKDAPGPSVYVIGLNGDPTSAKEFNVPEIGNEYFDSELSHPDVKGKGVYKDGHNPFTKLFQ
ncbi:hypothetical protein [Lysinibacillus sphaericus]|uniref:hypothetical protein n=1 Tax=Lysinibacillus sphaericus TaxID=1421 RepID=UPI0018CCAA84|nr:hypothetical protein [Lysinibacillus sphaericus]